MNGEARPNRPNDAKVPKVKSPVRRSHTVMAKNPSMTGSKKRKRGLPPRKNRVNHEVAATDTTCTIANVKVTELQNGHVSNATSELSNDDLSRCNVCGHQQKEMVDLSGNAVMREALTAYCKITDQKLDSTLASLCVQCVYKINAHREVTRSLQIRLHRLTNGQIQNAAQTALKIDSKQKLRLLSEAPEIVYNNLSIPNAELETPQPIRTLKTTAVAVCLPTPPCVSEEPVNGVGSLNAFDESTLETTSCSPKIDEDGIFFKQRQSTKSLINCSSLMSAASSHSNSSQSPENNNSMLEISSERTEPALITESGGKIGRVAQKLVCKHCARVYQRKNHYGKHILRCSKRWRHADKEQYGCDVSTSKSVGALNTTNSTSSRRTAHKRERTFHCNQCNVTVESIQRLREHRRIHLQRYYCKICGREYYTTHEYELHRLVCEAIEEVKNFPETAPTVRVTRARSYISSYKNSVASSNYMGRIRAEDDDALSDDSYYDTDDDDDDDDVSVADTMYTKRMHFTGKWVANSNSSSYLSLCDNNFFFDEDEHITTYKEYELHLLSRLKAQINTNQFSCFVPGCNFQLDNLVSMLLHDYLTHFNSAWYHCKKCGFAFTSKVHLDYHLDRQNSGRFFCFKCGNIFEFQHQLDWHMIEHKKRVNYRCNYCKFEFLTKEELLQHCDLENHDPNGERELIRIDHTASIANDVPLPREKYEAVRGYTACTLNLSLVKRPSHYRHKSFKYKKPRIGDVLFQNQRNHNCWGWKSRRQEECKNKLIF